MIKGPALLSNKNYVVHIHVQNGWPFYTLLAIYIINIYEV